MKCPADGCSETRDSEASLRGHVNGKSAHDRAHKAVAGSADLEAAVGGGGAVDRDTSPGGSDSTSGDAPEVTAEETATDPYAEQWADDDAEADPDADLHDDGDDGDDQAGGDGIPTGWVMVAGVAVLVVVVMVSMQTAPETATGGDGTQGDDQEVTSDDQGAGPNPVEA